MYAPKTTPLTRFRLSKEGASTKNRWYGIQRNAFPWGRPEGYLGSVRMDGKTRRRKNEARYAAQAIVRNGFVGAAAARELRPDLKAPSAYGSKLMDDPIVQEQVTSIMNRKEQTAEKYKDELWSWFLAPPGDKDVEEKRRTAARILARPYFDPKAKGIDAATQSFRIDGLGDTSNLTDDVGSKKVQ